MDEFIYRGLEGRRTPALFRSDTPNSMKQSRLERTPHVLSLELHPQRKGFDVMYEQRKHVIRKISESSLGFETKTITLLIKIPSA